MRKACDQSMPFAFGSVFVGSQVAFDSDRNLYRFCTADSGKLAFLALFAFRRFNNAASTNVFIFNILHV